MRRITKLAADRRALTLVEVIAALCLLAGTVTALLLAYSRSLRQLGTVEQKRRAAWLAEELIVEWRLTEEDVTTPAEGLFESAPGWSWRRSVDEYHNYGHRLLARVRLEVDRLDELRGVQHVATYEWIQSDEQEQ